MRRGFKTEAERHTTRLQEQTGVAVDQPLDLAKVADLLRVKVLSAAELIDVGELRELERLQPGCFSAVTFHMPGGTTFAIYNPLNEPERQRSDIGHELSHILLGHEVREIEQIAGHTFLTCNPDQEAEANWLAGSMLLPRALLLREARKGTTPAQLAAKYEVSEQMARFRLNASGVQLQVARGRRPSPRK